MANKILTAIGWQDRVRSKLGAGSAYLPDADIEQPDIIDVAEANIIKQIPGYATLTGSELVFLEAATVCECAALLCPSMPARMPKKEQGPHFSHELDIDWGKKQADLETERNGFVLKAIGHESSITNFALAGPNRS